MPVFIVKLVFTAISYASYFISRCIFSTIACLLVITIKAFKIPGENAKGMMEQVAEFIKSLIEYVLSIAVDSIASAIATSFDFVKGSAVGSASALVSAFVGLMDQTRGSMEGLFKDLPELADGFKDMVTTIVSDLFTNYKEALAYLTENV